MAEKSNHYPDYSTSMRPPRRLDIPYGTPGPKADGPKDPRLEYPNQIQDARKKGEGCSSCKWERQCLLLIHQKKYGTIEHETGKDGKRYILSTIGTSCESWNEDFPPLTQDQILNVRIDLPYWYF